MGKNALKEDRVRPRQEAEHSWDDSAFPMQVSNGRQKDCSQTGAPARRLTEVPLLGTTSAGCTARCFAQGVGTHAGRCGRQRPPTSLAGDSLKPHIKLFLLKPLISSTGGCENSEPKTWLGTNKPPNNTCCSRRAACTLFCAKPAESKGSKQTEDWNCRSRS